MSANVQSTAPARLPVSSAPVRGRIYGLGSVFGKTLRDSRRATLLVGGLMGLFLLILCEAVVTQFDTAVKRQELADIVRSVPPILAGLAGKPVSVDTMGGYIQYKYGTFFPLIVSLWSIVALSGTLAGEARRGSLDFLVAAPVSRRRIALEKVAGHIVVMVLAMVFVFVAVAVAGSAFAKLPGDEISVGAAAGFALWLAALALVSGSLAFAASQFFGRSAGIGIAGIVTFAGFIFAGYGAAIPEIAPLANLTWFGWTGNHIPLSGLYDWPSVVVTAVVAIVFIVIGVEAFVRRDLGATTPLPTLSLPSSLAGLRGPIGRSVANALPTTLAWGIGIGVFGMMLGSLGGSFIDQIRNSPDLLKVMGQIFPGYDLVSTGGFLELLFVGFGLILGGLATAVLVNVWASDETSGRLEMILSTPLSRGRWVVAGGVGLMVSLAIMVALVALGILIGASAAGGDVATPVVGTLVVLLYGIALAGIGIAVGGLVGTGAATATVIAVVLLTWFADFLVPPLGLPGFLHQLALTSHYGFTMLGQWDLGGVAASLIIAIGGVAIGAWGFTRRDLRS